MIALPWAWLRSPEHDCDPLSVIFSLKLSCGSSTGSVAPSTPASNSCGSSTGSVAPSTPASNSHTMNMMTSSATRDLFYRHLEAEDICPKMAKTADRRDRTCWVPSQEADQIWDPGWGRAEAEVQHISANSNYCVTSFKKTLSRFSGAIIDDEWLRSQAVGLSINFLLSCILLLPVWDILSWRLMCVTFNNIKQN